MFVNLGKFALKSKICIGLAPGQTSEVGHGQSQGKFFWSDGRRLLGRTAEGLLLLLLQLLPLLILLQVLLLLPPHQEVGRSDGPTADGGQTEVFTLL